MADLPKPNDDTGVRPDPGPNSTPRWVVMFGIIALAVVLLLVIVMLTGGGPGGGHGPARH